jgi:hypothetical protein
MADLRSEIRAAFQKEQTLNPSSPDLRRNIVQSVAARPRRRVDLQWMAVAAAIVIGALIVVSLMSTRAAHHGVPSHPPTLVGDYGPPPAGVALFYLQDPRHNGWYVGFDWTGKPRATIKLATALDANTNLDQAPDGSGFQLAPNAKGGGGYFYSRLGTEQTEGLGGMWSDDYVHTCAIVFDPVRATTTLITGGAGLQSRPVAVLAVDSSVGQSGIGLVACSFKTDRAIAVRTTVSWPSEMWVIRLSDGKVLTHRAIQNGNRLASVIASRDGTLIAENSLESVGLQGADAQPLVIRRMSDGAVLAKLDPAINVIAFSEDNSHALVTTSTWYSGFATHLAVIEVATGTIVWRYDGSSELAGYLTQPNGADFVVMLKTPRDQFGHPQIRVLIVAADGMSTDIPGSYVRP